MKKMLITIVLILIAGIVIYFTFVIAYIKIIIGAILLGVMLIALLGLWISWKIKKD